MSAPGSAHPQGPRPSGASPGARRWVTGRLAAGEPRVRLLCFPQAGGAAGAFSVWRPHLPDGLELAPVELPGRGTRGAEPLPTDLDTLVATLVDALATEFTRPYALFGHSFGGLLAYELALAAQRHGIAPPRAVLVSGARPPHLPPTAEPVQERDDAGLLRWLRATGGMPENLLRHTGYVRSVLAAVRADLTLGTRHRRAEPAPLDCPLHTFGGSEDPVVSPGELRQWQPYATSGVRVTLYPGAHFYLYDDPARLLGDIAAVLTAS
ncbi:thioesterase [Streptomyces longispororuber]|uniref:Thioesterase n=1 Tax=Streptomyces longispororuber TaxID=68230 RepID=A0A919DSD2_9ACTN|nr:alpha/beta fold hydrolase [Streptomyces longispororuber]GHE75308.1 thioesterase [Streptomyces longispororuber]